MTATIYAFPRQPRRVSMDLAWAQAADKILQTCAGWLFQDAYGMPDVPGWVGDAWREHVMGAIYFGAEMHTMNWDHHWAAFVNQTLANELEWRNAVAAKLEDASCLI